MQFDFIIPARMAASRFPGKVLKPLGEKVVVDWAYDNCCRTRCHADVMIATDAPEVADHCRQTGRNVKMTKEHNCCSNRTAEVAATLSSKWVVEVQGDEPFLWASLMERWLSQAVTIMDVIPGIDVFISAAPLQDDVSNPKFVKIIRNVAGRMLWASRSKIPSDFKRPQTQYIRHTGFYLWRRISLLRFADIEPGPVEKSEDTHALRLVENEFNAHVLLLEPTHGIDVPEDLVEAESFINQNPDVIVQQCGV
jgi:3-deoxy-manno-octulosonate cytidylyltransferase (CMP-KDO synthetase)